MAINTPDGECVFCGDYRVIHQHHIVPRRFGGGDEDVNLLAVCPTCHAIIEDVYDQRFYREVRRYFDRSWEDELTTFLTENRVGDARVGEKATQRISVVSTTRSRGAAE